MRSANIFDAIEPALDQRIFDGITPRRSVVKFIQRVYYHALDRRLGVTGTDWADLYFTGSLTTFQYSSTSDADVSVFPDYDRIWKHLDIDPQEARKRLIEMSIHFLDGTFLPGTQHPLQFFVVPPGILPTDLYKPGLRSAFDLLHNHWIVPPERSRSHNVQAEMPQEWQRAADIADKMSTMLDAGEYNAARELWHNVHAKRQLDQRAGLGDYSEGNIVYKWLLHEGLFDRIRSELGEYIAKVAVDYSDGLGLSEYPTTPAVFNMPPEIENRYIQMMECPECGGHLRKKETGTIYCEYCGWRPRQSAVDHLWDERVTTKVIYDFDKDRIVLGTQADLPKLKGENKIVGEYKDGRVTLFDADKQWITPSYFRRLWHVSYPDKELKDVFLRRDSGDEYMLKDLPRKRRKSSVDLDTIIEEFKNEKWQHVKGEITIEDLKDPKIANGLCHTVSLSFMDFAQKHGLEAWLPRYGTGTPEAIGYDDRKIKGPIGHYWTYVKVGEDTYGVDWTAAQFGYDDIPVVQKMTESGWMREWLSAVIDE